MPAPKGTLGKGLTIGYGSAQAGPFTLLASIMDCKPPGLQVGKAETTCYTDSIEQFIQGWLHAGDAHLKLLYVTAQTTTVYGFVGTSQWWQITLPDTHTIVFEGFVDDYQMAPPIKDKISEDVKMCVQSQPVYT